MGIRGGRWTNCSTRQTNPDAVRPPTGGTSSARHVSCGTARVTDVGYGHGSSPVSYLLAYCDIRWTAAARLNPSAGLDPSGNPSTRRRRAWILTLVSAGQDRISLLQGCAECGQHRWNVANWPAPNAFCTGICTELWKSDRGVCFSLTIGRCRRPLAAVAFDGGSTHEALEQRGGEHTFRYSSNHVLTRH